MPPKLKGFEFYEKSLKKSRYVVAPMVDASELAWRMLSRRYGAELCYTPMLHSAVFIRDPKYRKESLSTCPEDRPLIVQFCANDPDVFSKAVELTIQSIECDAIDLNLGCPQIIAKRGHFGSYLQDEWELLRKMISKIHDNFEIPITCKVRVFEDISKTIDYCKMLESAGVQLITVHGRTREQKGPLTGIASWKHIEAVRKAISIPMFANGNIQCLEDVHRCLQETGVQGVMSAEGHLTNPAIFAGINPPVWQMGLEYLDLAETYPCPLSYARGHLFKLLHHLLQIQTNFDVREIIAKSSELSDFREAVKTLQSRYQDYHDGKKEWQLPDELSTAILILPPWLCQPYVRPPPEEYVKKMQSLNEGVKRKPSSPVPTEDNPLGLSKKKLKKLERNPRKIFSKPRENCKICKNCPNPSGNKCDFEMCKVCCQKNCYDNELDCKGHQIWIKSKREKARHFEKLRAMSNCTNSDSQETSSCDTAKSVC